MYLFSKELFALLKMSHHEDICRYLGIVLVSHCFLFLYYRYVNYYFLTKRNTVFMVEMILSGLLGLIATAALIAAWGDVAFIGVYDHDGPEKHHGRGIHNRFFQEEDPGLPARYQRGYSWGLMLLQAQDTPFLTGYSRSSPLGQPVESMQRGFGNC